MTMPRLLSLMTNLPNLARATRTVKGLMMMTKMKKKKKVCWNGELNCFGVVGVLDPIAIP